MSQNPNLFLSVGKEIKDEYGREIGRIASFALTPSGKFDAVFIEQTGGKFVKLSTEHLQFDGANVTMTSTVKSRANSFCNQIPLLWRKDQALKELADKNKISKELYEELHHSFEGALNQLKREAQALTDEIDKEIDRCANEIKELNYALVHLELEHEIGKIDDQAYQTAFNIIQENIKRVNNEKSDFEQTSNKLSNILLGDTPKTEEILNTAVKMEEPHKESTSASEVPELPEPPVVVYVKEIGKAGI
ncbi:CdvA-like protein [Candidatus Bathyarchaeota archaeon]|nr:CdvA-like protein [Candidatus Bathyarchaeota archaeon]